MQDYTRNQKGCDWGVIKTCFSSSTNVTVLNRTVQYSSKTPYLIVSGGLLAAEDRKMEDFEEAYTCANTVLSRTGDRAQPEAVPLPDPTLIEPNQTTRAIID